LPLFHFLGASFADQLDVIVPELICRISAAIHNDAENAMKFICLGYSDEKMWDALSKREIDAMIEECFVYDDLLRKNGHFVGGEALQSARNAATLRWQNGKVVVTDGPYAETKEQLGGILILEARDRKHAIELMSQHPGVRLGGPFEIRPADDTINEMVAARSRTTKR
jgi:hypothetical protein